MSDRLRVLGFEPYDAGSHRAVRESITRRSRHDWRWICRPGRAWKWRMRLAAIELVEQADARDVWRSPPDLIFATSLMSTADLRAALPPRARRTPLALYMHENQAAYPAGELAAEQRHRDVHFALTNLTSALTADLVIWNSRWNLRSFLDGMDRILAAAPDLTLAGDWRQRIERRSTVIWPPVEPPPRAIDPGRRLGRPIRVVWPHRWEHDKGPEELLHVASRDSERLDLRWTILGERFRQTPPAFDQLRERLAGRLEHIGFEEDREAYWRHLARADWVLSTARHEYFGLAVVEALLAGCLPWLPNRLSYPELLPEMALALDPEHPPSDPAAVRSMVAEHLVPCLAGHAVARLDETLASVVSGR